MVRRAAGCRTGNGDRVLPALLPRRHGDLRSGHDRSEYAPAIVLRIVFGILAVTLLPLGLIFAAIGLIVDEVEDGTPEAFLYIGAPLAAVGLAFAIAFTVLWRREAARRRRRRAGLRTRAEVVDAQLNWSVRVNGRPVLRLTVSFAPAGTVTGSFFAQDGLRAGESIDVLYDPSEPSNFEPVPR